jgi:anti-sigma B factor antagonist
VNIEKKQIKPGIVVLEMTGRIQMVRDRERIEQEVQQLIRENNIRVIFDLSLVDHIDSAGIGKIVACISKLAKSGGALRLAGVKGMVENVLKLTQVHKIVGIYPTASDAAADFPLAPGSSPKNLSGQ